MEKDINVWLQHIREAIDIIDVHMQGCSFEEFQKSITIQDAVIRRVEIIGEAVNNIPEDFIQKHPEVEWLDIISMRNILAHEYFGVKLKIVWDTVKTDLPKLKEQLNKL
ncbi:MAG: hypothetical protein A3I39_01695 [Candidatus Yanofskybacteria bacterium RIFCSPLOWO2_02_FULL_47_9b]|uniref:DUF86 domain-containing protein n=1 Tax=Candidatus Yanofskybacteria bacterium RIFCSPLOWO2_02_FULL_47_9b TaxID=1802708 RepID=A0A1F8HAV0_9BACT|nr:MAG: hypothetical protein A3I39_01695 [Candidatus Yanofskybacteria bacterium RIFCSPLOWO2_02_FULL_47_9b]